MPAAPLAAEAPGPPHLTAAQRLIAAAPAVPPPSSEFRFDSPLGPRFTEPEQDAQRVAGRTILPLVWDACRSGAPAVRIPPGNYRFGKERWDRDGVIPALEFKGLQRPPEDPFTIDATGSTFWFDLPDDQAPTAHFALGFKDCRNIVFRGATLDRGTSGHVEGRIIQLDPAGRRIEIELSPGLTVPEAFNHNQEQRIIPFKADGRFCAPLYALQAGGERLAYESISPGTRPGTYWVTMRAPAVFETLRDPNWRRANGDLGVLEPGDGVSCVYAVSCAIELIGCANVTVDGVHVYLPKGWAAEWGGDGGHLWKNCYLGPRPGTSQWQGGEGFMFCATRRGTTLDNVTIRHTADDIANIHGYWGHVQTIAGQRVTFEPRPEFRRTVWRDLAIGDRLVFHHKTSGRRLGEAIVTASDADAVILDRSAEPFAEAIAEWPDHACRGWTIQNCRFEDDYQRLLIQTGSGIVRNCTFTRLGNAIELNSVMPYVEGGVPRDITIVDNRFTDVNPQPHGAAITVHARSFGAGLPPLGPIVIQGNTFVGSGGPAIQLEGVDGGTIVDNRFEGAWKRTAVARPQEPRQREAVCLERCTGIRVERNVVVDQGRQLAPDSSPETGGLGRGDRGAE